MPLTSAVRSIISRLRARSLDVKNVGPVPGYKMSTYWRKRPKGWPGRHTYWTSRDYHTGADWSAPKGASVLALNTGYAIRRNDKVLGSCLLLFWIGDKDKKTYTSWYCHLSDRTPIDKLKVTHRNIQGVRHEVREVHEGDLIGFVGDTGTGANGPHLHLERRRSWTKDWSGTDLDPMWGWSL